MVAVPNPQAQGWGPPCKVPTVTLVRADGLRLPVHRDIKDLAALLLDLTELSGYDVLPGQTWGGLCREVAGSSSWSWHAWWLAIDLNAPANPRATAEWHRRNARGTRPFGLAIVCDIPEKVIRLWEDYHFGWLGRATSKPDPMHMQYQGTPAQAREDLARLRRWVADNGGTVPAPLPIPTPTPTPEDDPMYDLVTCIEARKGEMPNASMADAWWFVDAASRAWCPTPKNAEEAFNAKLCRRSSPREVSPNWIMEKRPLHPMDDRLDQSHFDPQKNWPNGGH